MSWKSDLIMKTIEQKAKAYDEIIERAKTMLAAGDVMYGKENNASQLITDIIPDLKENGDEKIYEEIYSIVHHCYQDRIDNLVSPERKKEQLDKWEKAKDWLEKKKELFESGRGLYYYDGEKTTYCGYPATKENPYDFAMSQQKEQKQEIISISEMVSKYRNTDEYDDDGNYKGKPVNCMIRAYEQGIRDTLLKVKDQKSTLSEETIKHLYTLARYIKSKGHEDDGEFLEGVANKLNRLCVSWKSNEEQIPVTNDKQQECPYKDLILVKDFFGQYKRKCTLSNKACNPKECTYGEK